MKKKKRTFRLVIYNEDSFRELFITRFSIPVLSLISSVLILLTCAFFYSIFAYTPVKYLIPGYPSQEVESQMLRVKNTADSLEYLVEANQQYINTLQSHFRDEKPITNSFQKKSTGEAISSFLSENKHLPVGKETFQQAEEEKGLSLLFFSPMQGRISEHYNPKIKHYGLDVMVENASQVVSVLPGVVIIANWTLNTGYVIALLHPNGYVSVYKHNQRLLKQIGDNVAIGEAIALSGNTGQLSSGPHLHFEIWNHRLQSLDPELYISL